MYENDKVKENGRISNRLLLILVVILSLVLLLLFCIIDIPIVKINQPLVTEIVDSLIQFGQASVAMCLVCLIIFGVVFYCFAPNGQYCYKRTHQKFREELINALIVIYMLLFILSFVEYFETQPEIARLMMLFVIISDTYIIFSIILNSKISLSDRSKDILFLSHVGFQSGFIVMVMLYISNIIIIS